MSRSRDFSKIVDEFNNQSVEVQSRPAVFYLNTLAGCPFNCIICKPKPTKIIKMAPEILQKIEPYLPDVEVILANGGSEPLLDDINWWVRQSIDNDFVLHLETNGFLLTEEMSRQLIQTRLSVRFSVHAARPDTYYRIMGLDMERSMRNIKRLVELSKESTKEIDLWFSYCVMKENIHEIEDLFHLAHDCGIKSVRLMRLLPTLQILRGITSRGMTFRFFEQTGKHVDPIFFANLPRYRALAEELGIKIERGDKVKVKTPLHETIGEYANIAIGKVIHKYLFPIFPPKAGPCAAPWIGQLVIDINGDVSMCCESDYILGNLKEQSIDEMWHGPKMTKIRKAFHDGHFPRECGYCRGFGFNNYPNNSFPGIAR